MPSWRGDTAAEVCGWSALQVDEGLDGVLQSGVELDDGRPANGRWMGRGESAKDRRSACRSAPDEERGELVVTPNQKVLGP